MSVSGVRTFAHEGLNNKAGATAISGCGARYFRLSYASK